MAPKNFLIALSLLVLTSCGENKPLEIITVEKQLEIAKPDRPTPIALSDIKWEVINSNDTIYYGLTIAGYKTLANNMLEIKRYIIEQNNIITYYENSIGEK